MLGPVFKAELLTSSRRARNFLLRVAYCSLILLVLWGSYPHHIADRSADNLVPTSTLASIAMQVVGSFMILQGMMVLLLTPALVAGAIADEKQRKTMHYLMTSLLTSPEIVVGKLAARVLMMVVLITIGIPALSIITLIGGVPPKMIVYFYLGCLSTAYLLGGLSILISVWTNRVRDALVGTYLLGVVWFFVPTLIDVMSMAPIPTLSTIYQYLGPITQPLAISSPFTVFFRYIGAPFGPFAGMTLDEIMARFLPAQLLLGTTFIGLAVWRLRPAYRAQEGGGRGRWFRRVVNPEARAFRRLIPRPPCGDDAMMWKETQFGRLRGVARFSALFVGILFIVVMTYAFTYMAEDVYREVRSYGYQFPAAGADVQQRYNWYGTTGWQHRETLHGFIQGSTVALFGVLFLGVAARGAGAISGEKENDSWLTLTASPLEGPEILRAKLVGAILGLRPILAALLFLWLIGLITGAIHPVGLLASALWIGVFLWFAAALGIYFSMTAKTTRRALVATALTLIFCNGGYLLLLVPFQPRSSVIAAGVTVAQVPYTVMSYRDFHNQTTESANRGYDWEREQLVTGVAGLAFYFVAAALLTRASFRKFDLVAERPIRSGELAQVIPTIRSEGVTEKSPLLEVVEIPTPSPIMSILYNGELDARERLKTLVRRS